jgi:hypothetical protein
MTEYPLQSNPIQINGEGGNDTLIVRGGPGSTATLTPSDTTPGAGEINLDGHIILFGTMQKVEADIPNFVLITPNVADNVNIGQPPDQPITIGGQSGGVQIVSTALSTNVTSVVIDTSANEPAAGANDSINTFQMDETIAPSFSIIPGDAGADTLNVNGPFTLANNPTGPTGVRTLSAIVNQNGHLRFDSNVTELNALVLQLGQATINNGGNKFLSVKQLVMQMPARLDIRGHTLIVDHDNAANSGDIPGFIQTAFQPAAPTHWNGPGITSSIAIADPKRAIGFNEAMLLFGPGGGNYRGYNVDGDATIVTLTVPGDVNLDRKITFSDLVTAAANFGSPTPFWYKGNFNYDGQVDFSDLIGVAANFGLSVP